MHKKYSEQVKTFFQTYGIQRRQWVGLIAEWREEGSHKELRAKIEALMAQVEEYHVALNALLVQSESDLDRVDRLYRQMDACYKELVQLTKPVWRVWLESIIVAGFAAFVIRTCVFGIYHVPTGSAEPNILVGDRLWGNKMVYLVQKPVHGDLVIFNDPEFGYSQNTIKRLWQKYAGLPLFGLLPSGPDNWVKRVVGVPGDTIEGRMEGGRTVVYRNGEKLDESYVNPYPLLVLRKQTGFFAPSSFLGCVLPSFLHTRARQVSYTYDPLVPLDQQPYYHMLPQEILRHPISADPLLLPAFEPSYEHRTNRNVDVFGPFTVPAGKYWVQGDSRRNSRDSRYWMFLDEEHVLGRASIVLFSLDSEEPFWLFALLKDPVGFFAHVIRWSRFLKPLWGIPDLREHRLSEIPTEKLEE
ncbi:MAG: Signal peptidase [Candidatus Dependentiae bacterium]|nr:Signal peptidase [Candidatus Dependentiae bacterium]